MEQKDICLFLDKGILEFIKKDEEQRKQLEARIEESRSISKFI